MTTERRPASMEEYHAICQHYYAEAYLLQERRYREWLGTMVAEDIHLWMPVVEVRFLKDKRPAPTPGDAAIFNDRLEELTQRVERLYTGQVWMEDPPSKIRYFINNVQAFDVGGGEYETRCNIFIQRHRRQNEMSQHSLGREDRLRRDGAGFRVVTRKLLLDARVIQDKNLYFFV